jgi:hypothetical protein
LKEKKGVESLKKELQNIKLITYFAPLNLKPAHVLDDTFRRNKKPN